MRVYRFIVLGAVATGAAAAFASAAHASAQECYLNGSSIYCSYKENANAAPNVPTASALMRAGVTSQVSLVGNHLQNAFGGKGGSSRVALGETGVSAGEAGQKVSLWLSGAGAVTENTEVFNEFSATSRTATMGLDFQPSSNWVVGVSTFLEGANVETDYNNGDVDRVGYSVVPYAAYNLGQGTTVDGLFGLTYLDGEISRGNGVAFGGYDGYRVMTALNAHHSYALGAVSLRGDVGYLYAHEKQNGYTESGTNAAIAAKTTNLSQGKIGGRVGYGFDTVEPYVQAHYLYDFVRNNVSGIGTDPRKPENDKDEVVLAVGLDFFPTATESVGLEITQSFLRERERTTTAMITGRVSF